MKQWGLCLEHVGDLGKFPLTYRILSPVNTIKHDPLHRRTQQQRRSGQNHHRHTSSPSPVTKYTTEVWDADPQGSATDWAYTAEENGQPLPFLRLVQ